MKRLATALVIIGLALLSGCDLLPTSGGSVTKAGPVPTPVTEWGNMVRVADTYSYAPPPADIFQFVDLGIVGATSDAVCIVLWMDAVTAYASCRNTTSDGQWPATCSAGVDNIVSCSSVSSVGLYFASALGPARTLTLEEAELADEIRRQSYCIADRLDGSGSPCVIS